MTEGFHDAGLEPPAQPAGRQHRKLVVAGIVAASMIAVAVTVLALVLWPRGATPVTEEEALESFRRTVPERGRSDAGSLGTRPASAAPTTVASRGAPAGGGTGASGRGTSDPSSPGGGSSAPPLLAPPAGVYSYAASGYETVSLGPARQVRNLAATVTATVTNAAAPSGCWTFELALFAEHTERTTLCPGVDGSLQMQQHSKSQKIGLVSAGAEMKCSPGTLLVGPPVQGGQWGERCDMATQTPVFTASSTHTGTVATVALEDVDVGGRPTEAWHVSIRRDVTGDLDGYWHEDLWFSRSSGTIVRIVRDAELRGPATFREESTLRLRSLEPSV